MNSQVFKYPKAIQVSKVYSKFMIPLGVLLLPLIILNNKISQFTSIFEYILAMVSVPLIMSVGSALYLGSWSDIEVTDGGLDVEFLWRKLHIPWNGIIGIQQVGSQKFAFTIVLTERRYLTFLHVVYCLFTIRSFQRGFNIHTQLLHSEVLMKIIQEKRLHN